MEQASLLKIFLASPSDVKPEREMIFALKNDLDHLIGKPNKLRFEFVNWERNAYPGVGSDGQDVINHNIGDDYNIFIGIFWQRFGTPTSRAESGTKEEFDRAFEKFKANPEQNHIMLYFKTAPPNNIYDLDFTQFEKVKKFKAELPELGVLYWEFEKTEDLKNIILIHLSSLVKDKFVEGNDVSLEIVDAQEAESVDKYELLAIEIDKGRSSEAIEGILELIELGSDSLNLLPTITYNIVSIITFITNKFQEKTKEILAVNHIRDERLKLKKLKQIIDRMALDLDDYSKQLNEILPEFSNTLNVAIESITKVLFLTTESSVFSEETEDQLRNNIPILYESVDTALIEIANFLKVMTDLPVMTSNFGSAKRRAELTTNSLLKEFLNAKKLLKSLVDI